MPQLYERQGGETLANTTVTGPQNDPAITYLADGRFVVVWTDGSATAPDTIGLAVRGQIFNANGTKSGAEFVLNSSTANTQNLPTIAALPSGGFVAAWKDASGTGGDTAAIRVQLFTSAGAKSGSEFIAHAVNAADQGTPSIAVFANNSFLVTFADASGAGADPEGYAVRAQLFTSAGAMSGSQILVNTSVAGNQVAPVAAVLADQSFVIAWTDQSGATEAGHGVRAQRFSSAGAKLGPEIQVNETVVGHQNAPAITALTNGNFVIVWDDQSSTGGDTSSLALRAQIYTAAGVEVGGEFLVNTSTNLGQQAATIAPLPGGGFVVSWQDNSGAGGDPSGNSIRAQVFDAAGNKDGLEFLVNSETQNHQAAATISATPGGGFTVAWADSGAIGGDASSGGVKFQTFTPDTNGVSDLALSTVSVGETSIENLVVGAFAASGVVNSAITYTILSDSSGGAFAVQGNRLVVVDNGRLDFETAPSVSLQVRATDANGGTYDETFVIPITDVVSEVRLAASAELLANATTALNQYAPDVAGLTSGGYVSVWQDSSGLTGDPSSWGIVAQRFDSAGARVGTELLINTGGTSGIQEAPRVAGLADGGFVVVWHDNAGDFSGTAVMAATVSASGVVNGQSRMNDQTAGEQRDPVVAGLASGGYVVAWTDAGGQGLDPNSGIYGRIVGPNGTSEFLLNTDVSSYQTRPSLAALGTGFVAVWEDYDPNSGDTNLRGQVFSATGAKLGGELVINTTVSSLQQNVAVTALASGGFAVTWTDYSLLGGDSSGGAIKLQIFEADGDKIGGEILVNTITAGNQISPKIAMLDSGGFVVTWEDQGGAGGDSASGAIKGQLFTDAGVHVGGELLINTITAGSQTLPRVDGLTGGGFAVVWGDASGLGGDADPNSVKAKVVSVIVPPAPPTLDLDASGGGSGFASSFTEDGAAASVADSDVAIVSTEAALSGATVTVADARPGDTLTLAGALAGGITATGVGTDQLTLSGSASAADYQAALALVRYASTSEHPTAGGHETRSIDVVVSDAGGASNIATTVVAVTAVHVGPTFTGQPYAEGFEGGIPDDQIFGLGGDDYLSGGDGSDLIDGGDGNDQLYGGLSNDTLIGGDGNDYLNDSAGVNVLDGGAGDDQLSASGADGQWLSGGEGADSLYASGNNSILLGGAGDDVIQAYGTGNRLTGGTGSDTYRPTTNGANLVTDFAAGDGGDVIDLSQLLSSMTNYAGPNPFASGHVRALQSGADTLLQFDYNGPLAGYSLTTTLILAGVTATSLTAFNFGGYHPDGTPTTGQTFPGTGGDDVVTGTIGPDQISGLGGNDQLAGGDDSDQIDGGAGNDQISGGFGSDTLTGGDDDDTIQDDSGVNSLDGGAGNDRLYSYSYAPGQTLSGGDGDDLLQVNSVGNTLTGGSGRDTFILYPYGGGTANVITDFTAGPGGDFIDVLTQLGYASGYAGPNPFATGHLRVMQSGGDTLLQWDPNGDTGGANFNTLATLTGVTATSLTSDNFSGYNPDGSATPGQVIDGTGAGETLTGTLGDDVISGLGGPDTITGGDGSDRLEGGAGDDQLNGGYGNDILNGGDDNDSLQDIYGVNILDGGGGDDTLQYSGGGSGQTLNGGEGDDYIYMYGALSTLSGDGGNDRLIVQGNGNSLSGGTGSDHFYVYSGSTGTTITDFTVGQGGDNLDIPIILQSASGYNGPNPFGTGYLRLVQSGADTLVQWDQNGGTGGANYVTLVTLTGVQATSVRPANVSGYNADGSASPPVGADQSRSGSEDQTLSGQAVATDVDSFSLTYALATGPAHGTVAFQTNGAFVYTPFADYHGADSFTFTASDGALTSDPATVSITLANVADAIADSANVAEDGSVVIDMLDNDQFETAPALASVTQGAHGTVVINDNNTPLDALDDFVTYTPNANFNGSDSFTYTASAGGASETQTVNVQVAAVNDAPTVAFAPGTVAKSGSEFLVNTVTSGAQTGAAVTALSGGGFVVTWTDPSIPAESSNIKAQVFNAAGVAVGGEILVNTVTAGSQGGASVARLASGGFVVSWNDNSGQGADASSTGIKAQIFDSAGGKVGGEFLVNTETSSQQSGGNLVSLPSGGFLATWNDSSGVGGDNSGSGIKAQFFDAAGGKVGGEILINTTIANFQTQPKAAMLASGQFIVTWVDQSASGGDTANEAIRAQIIDSAGAKIGGEFLVNTSTAAGQYGQSVTALVSGGFVVTWRDDNPAGDGANSSIKAQIFDAAGAKVGGEFVVNTTAAAFQTEPEVTARPSGGFVVAWQDSSSQGGDASFESIKAQAFDAAGAKVGAEFLVNTATANQQRNPAITTLASGDVLVTWEDSSFQGGDASGTAVKGQIFSPQYVAVEQAALSLKGSVTVADGDAGAGIVTATVSVGYGLLNVGVGTSGASVVSGNGTGTVVLSGTIAQLNALLNSDATSVVTFTADTDAPPATTVLTLAIDDNGNTGSGGALAASANQLINISAANDAPVLDLDPAAVGSNNSASYTEQAPVVTLASGISLTDADSAMLTGATVRIVGGSMPGDGYDYLGIAGSGAGTSNGIDYSYTALTGILTLSGTASVAAYQAVLAQVTFQSTLNDPGTSRTISWVVNDGSADSAAVTTALAITPVNDAPTLTATASNPTFTEGTGFHPLFSGVTASTVEAGQTVTSMTLTVSNVTDGADEMLAIDGTAILLTNGFSVVTSGGNTLAVSVTVTAGVATVTFSGEALSASQVQQLVQGFAYHNDSENPTDADRVVTITQIVDSGPNGGADDNVTAPNLVSTVNVNPVNDAPLNNVPGAQTINEDGSFTLSTDDGNAVQVADIDATTLTVTLTVEHGTLTLASTSGLSFGDGDGVANTNMTFSGTAAAINAALGSGLTYNPHPEYNGLDSVTVFTTDDGQSGIGGTREDSDTVAITVNSVNDAPSGADKTLSGSEDYPLVFTAADFGFTDPVDGDDFLAIIIDSFPANGTLFLDVDGPGNNAPIDLSTLGPNVFVSVSDIDLGRLYFQPDADEFGTGYAQFTFRVQDDGGMLNGGVDRDPVANTISIDITPDNLPPVVDLNGAAGGINYSTTFVEDGAAVAIGAGILVSDPNSGQGDLIESATITLSDRVAGDALTLTGALPSGISAVTTASVGAITIQLTGPGTGAQYQALIQSIQYSNTNQDPTAGGTDVQRTITVAVNDGTAASAVATTTMNITAVNDPAVAQPDAYTITESGSIVAGNLFANNGSGADSDPDGPPLAVSAVNGSTGAVGMQITLASGALLTVNANGTFDYNPNHAFDATPAPGSGASNARAGDSFSYDLAGGNTTTVSISFTGLDTNDYILGTSGGDGLNGGASNDRIESGAGSDGLLGGSGDDYLDGGSESDFLFGEDGADTLLGRDGDDRLEGGADRDGLTGGDGDDFLFGGDDGDWLFGDAGSDTLVGDAGDDYLEGGAGRDGLTGGLGADFLAGGADGDWLFGGDDGDTLLGEDGDDRLEGGAGTDGLQGGAGADYLAGGADVDWLFGGDDGDTLLGEGGDDRLEGGAGTDGILGGAGADYIDGGSQDDVLFGEDGSDIMLGGDGDDILDGGLGVDGLAGGNGADSFVFSTALGAGNVDTITDFVSGVDAILIDQAVFSAIGLGTIEDGVFVLGTVAQDANDRILYDQTTGALYYDADGNGAGAAVQFASLGNTPPLTASDFTVI